MATEAELDRLQGLIVQLAPLAKRASGDLIKSDDWDLVVGSLIAVARAQVAEETGPVRPHEHAEQVSLGWLDPKLRQLVEGGPLSDPAQVARLGEVERRSERIEAAQTGLGDDTKQLRELVHDVSARDLERQAAMTELRRAVDNLANAKDDVAAVRATLKTLDTKVRDAVEIGSSLTVDGEIVDVGDVVTRIGQLEALRERLTLPTGETLDAAEFQKQLAKLRNDAATQADIDEALKLRPVELPEEAKTALVSELETKLTADFAASSAALEEEIAASTDEKLGVVDAKVAQAVADATPTITAGVVETLRPEIAAAADGAVTRAADETKKLVEAADAALRDLIGSSTKELTEALPGLIAADVAPMLDKAISPLQDSLAKLEGSIATVDSTLKTFDAELGGLSARIEDVASVDAAALDKLTSQMTLQLQAQVDALRKELGTTSTMLTSYVDSKLAETSGDLLAQTKLMISDELAGFSDTLPSLIDTQLKLASTTTTVESTTISPLLSTRIIG